MYGAAILKHAQGPVLMVHTSKHFHNSPGVGILCMWTFDIDYVTQNSSALFAPRLLRVIYLCIVLFQSKEVAPYIFVVCRERSQYACICVRT